MVVGVYGLITLPRNESDAMRLRGQKIHIEAEDEIRLACGGGVGGG